ncbi:hypothetical protein DFQ28_010294 [Apophysomyces sp. BC1034]|nr:hypothetical protein DFQ28_010294 [Apophysomyces sp. BC1034]
MDITKYFAKKPAAKAVKRDKDDEDFQAISSSVQSKNTAVDSKAKAEETAVDPKEFFSSSKSKPKRTQQTKKTPIPPKQKDDDDFKPIEVPSDDDYEVEETKPSPKEPVAAKPKSSAGRSTKTEKKRKQTATPPKDEEVDTLKEEDEPPKKKGKGFYEMMHREPPKALGTRPLPVGKPNCLSGFTFVISGEFETIDKSTTTDIIKRYGGRITGAVSGKTTYLVRGRDAGASKTEKAKKLGTKILDEDAFYELVGNADEKETEFSLPKEKTPSAQSKSASKASASKVRVSEATSSTATTTTAATTTAATTTAAAVGSPDAQSLWTEKYKPKNTNEIMGNKDLVKKITSWLENWQESLASNFQAAEGKDEILGYRGVLISGPPGIGKTTTAHVVSQSLGYEILEFNASDVRSKKVLQDKITDMIDNRTMTEFYKDRSNEKDPKGKKVVLIMDEVDGMSSGDRGGSAELAALVRKTKIPIICICNDVRSIKVQPLAKVCFSAKFKRTPANQLRSRIMTIAFREKLQIDSNAIEELVHSTRNDIRQIINILSTYRRNETKMTYDDAKAIGKTNEKSSQLGIFDIPLELMSSRSWQEKSLAEKSSLYFHDAALAPLMIFENYTKCKPEKASRLAKTGSSQEIACREMELAAKAAEAIADGDLMDTKIHGWLGQNSKATKYKKLLTDMQAGIRLQSSASKFELRLSYISTLSARLFKYIEEEQFDEAIQLMDTYHLDRESLDTLNELEVGTSKKPLAKIPAKVKNAFTREYNKRNHPVLFQTSGVPIKKAKESEVIEDLADEKDVSGDEDEEDLEEDDKIEKDKLIKTSTKKRKAKAEPSRGPAKKKTKK